MVSIAREILLHDKLRFVITVASLGVAIVMTIYDVGMFFGVTGDSVNLIDRAHAELWLFEDGESHLAAPSLVPNSALGWARRLDGVNQACALDYSIGNLKIGDTRQVEVVGIDPACPLFQPWEVVEGDIGGLRRKDTIIVDDLALRGVNYAQLGDVVELNGREMRIVAVTHDNKSFSYPYVYINLRTFESVGGTPDHYSFVAVQVKPGADQDQIIRRLANANSDVAVSRAQEFRLSTIKALIAQGVGMIFVVVFVGVSVGMLIITLTMYTATMERLRDFAILKALGATRWKIWRIVLEQAITETTVSFGAGLTVSLGVDYFVEATSGIRGRYPIPVIIGCFVMMIILAILGSLISIRKATSVDPVMVFRA
jgi:putative ABC transport system permease protein